MRDGWDWTDMEEKEDQEFPASMGELLLGLFIVWCIVMGGAILTFATAWGIFYFLDRLDVF